MPAWVAVERPPACPSLPPPMPAATHAFLPACPQGYIHGDIKSSNVLLAANCIAKLADIAFSRRFRPSPPELESYASFAFEPPPMSGTFAWCV